MTTVEASSPLRQPMPDAWSWWEGRRLEYNLTLAAAGWAAYALAVALNYGFGHPVWRDIRGAAGMTLFLGTVYLLTMGAANVAFLLGPSVESWVRPAPVARYRNTAYALGRWGSLIVPASFPLVQLALLMGHAA